MKPEDQLDQDFETLPVVEFKEEILAAVNRHQIVICIGETGSGKTTQIPQFIADSGILGEKQVAITQPRRIAAITVAQRVSDEKKCSLGEKVGYTVRFDDMTSADTKIKYMTDGILVRECLSDKRLSQYKVIILDEAHERSLNTDILFGLIKGTCKLRPDLRLIVTSATLDTDKFGPYFCNCPIIRVPGRVFPVDIYHSKTKQVMTATGPSNASYVQSAVDVILKIHRKEEEGHILVFLTGQEEIEKACYLLREALQRERDDGRSMSDRELFVLPLYAALPSEAQSKVFKNAKYLAEKTKNSNQQPEHRILRKCVIATNIAETSITVPQVRFVVDAGYVKQKTYDPARGMEQLVVVPVSKIAALQRAGRAGRTGPGQCYRLYSSECFDNMMDETVPEIRRINLANTVLYLKALGIHDIVGFDFLDAPSEEQIMEALGQLHTLNAIDNEGVITRLGREMSSFPLEPRIARMLIESTVTDCNCAEEMAIICAMLSAESIWIQPSNSSGNKVNPASTAAANAATHSSSRLQMNFKQGYSRYSSSSSSNNNKSVTANMQGGIYGPASNIDNAAAIERERIEQAHAAFRHSFGDFHTYLNVFLTWESEGHFSPQWCHRNYINYRSMKTVRSVREHLSRDVAKLIASRNNAGTSGSSKRDDPDVSLERRISTAVTAGFFMNSAVRCANDSVFKYISLLDLQRQRRQEQALEVRMVHVHPTSALYQVAAPEYVLFQELVHSTKLYMKQVAKADRKYLKKLQNNWHYIDPYILCGRKLVEATPTLPYGAKKDSQNDIGTTTTGTTSHSTTSNSRRNDEAQASANSTVSSVLGTKRSLEKSNERTETSESGGQGGTTSSSTAGSTTNTNTSASKSVSAGNTALPIPIPGTAPTTQPPPSSSSSSSSAGAAAAEAARLRYLARKGGASSSSNSSSRKSSR